MNVTKRPRIWASADTFKLDKPIVLSSETNCFVTPDDVCSRVVDYLSIEENKTILEPSTGTGNLVNALLKGGANKELITAVELNSELVNVARNRLNIPVVQSCFLDYAKSTTDRFDYIVMNPPYSRNRAKHHVNNAVSLLNEGGRLIAIVPVTFKHELAYEVEFLPADTFTGTKIQTKIIEICKQPIG